MYVRDLSANEYPIMASYTIDDEINGNISVSMDVYPNKPNKVFLDELAEFWELVDDNDEVYRIIYCKKKSTGNAVFKTIRAIPKLYDVMDSTRIYQRFDGSQSPAQLLEAIFEPIEYTYNLIGSWNKIEVQGYGDGETCLAMFQKVLKRINAEFTFIGNVVTVRDRIGTDRDVMYRRRLNASNIIHEVDGQQFYTFMRGYGDFEDEGETSWQKAKLIREYTSPLAKLIGKREGPPIKNGAIKKTDTMDANLKNQVDNSIKISVTADLVDLREKNYPYAVTELGDTCWLIDELIQLDEQVRVVKRSRKFDWDGRILDLKFTFGSQGIVDRYNGKLSDAVSMIKDLLAGETKLPFPAMPNEIKIVTKMLTSVQTQLKVAEDGSVLAINKKDPKQLVIFNAAGLGVSDDGGKTFKSAITGRGIMGDLIVANTIKVDALEANWMQVGLKNYSDNIEFYGDRIEFYNSSHTLTSKITSEGQEYWYGDRYIGKTGESGKKGNGDVRGVSMQLSEKGDYLTWSYENKEDGVYYSMLTMDPKGRYTSKKGIYADLPFYLHGDIGMRGGSARLLQFGTSVLNNTNYPALLSADTGHCGVAFGTEYLYLIDNNKYKAVRDITKVTGKLEDETFDIPLKINSDGTIDSWRTVTFK
ncbi:hypothetical protein CBF34_07025 [Vagococcus penaei]|uniref:phage tail protein n=1 Tax=Vagococcus penaei TaxID=633807 RepID=UPI000F879BCF|nr:phage tail protein [Vagococcus penaei]RSU01405.1 hypothetical protein CBF34_07025 [Vagococcus penaei]